MDELTEDQSWTTYGGVTPFQARNLHELMTAVDAMQYGVQRHKLEAHCNSSAILLAGLLFILIGFKLNRMVKQ